MEEFPNLPQGSLPRSGENQIDQIDYLQPAAASATQIDDDP